MSLGSLEDYRLVLDAMDASAAERVDVPFFAQLPGLEALYRTMSAVAPAASGAHDEEWNPLSQRPHAPLAPTVGDELGGEVVALKEAVDAFTTLAHEMMHVALWEPFFAGVWRPRGKDDFQTFALMAEGFCFFYSDIVISGAIRVRLSDGEFAMDRATPGNVRFHPARAFEALGIRDQREILQIYIDGFAGGQTKLWQPRGGNKLAASTAAKVYDFYVGSLPLLSDVYRALKAFGGLTEFFERFCAIPGLPTFHAGSSVDLERYFQDFLAVELPHLGRLSASDVTRIRERRAAQMRAYYALQVRWLLKQGHVVGEGWTASTARAALEEVERYLDGLEGLLRRLDGDHLAKVDARYEAKVRKTFREKNAWVGHRWLIAPRRAGGVVSTAKALTGRSRVQETVAFLLDELAVRLAAARSSSTRTELMGVIQRLAAIGAAARGPALRTELAKPAVLAVWSVPLASFDPKRNTFRELVFSYQ